jgi:hypothetical protein
MDSEDMRGKRCGNKTILPTSWLNFFLQSGGGVKTYLVSSLFKNYDLPNFFL